MEISQFYAQVICYVFFNTVGAMAVWLSYGDGLRYYMKHQDNHGVNVTLVAMSASMLPTLGFGMLIFFTP
jgi:hypothetical protein